MIWASDHKGQVTFVGDEWLALTGQKPAQALGNGWTGAVHPRDKGLVTDGFEEACRLHTEFLLRYRLRQKSGTYIWVLGAASPSFTPLTREFIGYLGVLNRYEALSSDLTAKAEVGRFEPGKAMAKFGPITQLDLVADHLIMAKAVSVGCVREVTAAIDLALASAGQALVEQQRDQKRLPKHQ